MTVERAGRPGVLTPGLFLAGWGIFDLVEGIVDHHLLGVHHVHEGVPGQLAYDLGFLALGALLLVGGLVLTRRARTPGSARGPVPRGGS